MRALHTDRELMRSNHSGTYRRHPANPGRKTAIRAAAILSLIVSLWVAGCGGGGVSTGSTPTQGLQLMQASGKIILPAGFKTPLAGLTVNSGQDTQPVSSTGAFQLAVAGPGETLVTLQDASGRVVLMGLADGGSSGSPESGGHGEISAQKTAECLLFMGLDGFLLDPSQWSALRAYIRQTTQVKALSTVIAARVGATPTALYGGDSQLASAVMTAASGIVSGHLPPKFKPSLLEQPKNQVFKVSVVSKPSSSGGTSNIVEVQPEGEQGGLEVLQSPAGDGIQFVNHLRRRMAAFVYETSYQTLTQNSPTSVPPAPIPSTSQATCNSSERSMAGRWATK